MRPIPLVPPVTNPTLPLIENKLLTSVEFMTDPSIRIDLDVQFRTVRTEQRFLGFALQCSHSIEVGSQIQKTI